MPTDAARLGDHLAWRNQDRLILSDDLGREVGRQPLSQPQDAGVPWFNWMRQLHTGALFWSEWRWVNDVFALLAVALVVTGLIRWWHRKWI